MGDTLGCKKLKTMQGVQGMWHPALPLRGSLSAEAAELQLPFPDGLAAGMNLKLWAAHQCSHHVITQQQPQVWAVALRQRRLLGL